MEYAKFGRTDLKISRIGFGCAAIGGYDYGKTDDRESINAILTALDQGINFFDTADIYGFGHSEEVLGRAIRSRQDEAVIATKVGVVWRPDGSTFRDLSRAAVFRAVEASLQRLGVSCIHLCQIHWPDAKVPIEETMEALLECQTMGKVRYIGCCNFSAELVDRAQACGRLDSIQMPFSLGQRYYDCILKECVGKYEMSAFAYNVLAQGLFTGKYAGNSSFQGTDLRQRSELFAGDKLAINLAALERIENVVRKRGKTVARVAIRWVLDHPFITCALTGIKTCGQVVENAGACDWRLAPEDFEHLSSGDLELIRRLKGK
ncbi:MAG: aldo/keto reductase [Verrucomicrobia bacterium]|nr:aldo/keto reductase [Verrucomicrobiota bacterium]